MIRLGTFIVLSLAASVVVAQQPVTIRGRVVAAVNRQPLRHARISAAGHPSILTPVLTDGDGRFEITLPDGLSALAASKAGWASSSFAITRDIVRSAREIEIQLTRGASISGRVSNSAGHPISDALVSARRIDPSAIKGANTDSIDAATDDLGEYRIGGLGPGRYEVALQRLSTPAELVALTGRIDVKVPVGQTQSIEVRAGDDRSQLDFYVESADLPDSLTLLASVREFVDQTGHVNRAFVTRRRALEGTSHAGVVTGALVDAAGEPMEGVQVRALQVVREYGRMIARDEGLSRLTDDRGRYRLFGLPAGTYLVAAATDAVPSGAERADRHAFTRVYYPGAARIEHALAVHVEPELESSGVDITFAPSRVARVSGMALDPGGEPLVGVVRLVATQRSTAIAAEPLVSSVEPDGSFVIDRVPPGDFVVQAVSTNPGRLNEFGFEFVTVEDRDPPPLTIRASVGAVLEGRFVVDGGAVAPVRVSSVHAAPTDLDRAPAEGRGPQGLAVYEDGRFSLTGLRGAMRFVPVESELTDGWYLKTVTIGGLDVTDVPFDFGIGVQTYSDAQIILSPSGAAIAVSVTARAGTPASDFVAVAFPTARERWFTGSRHVKRCASGPNGRCQIGGLPPGEYRVVAVDRPVAGEWQTPEVLESLVPGATVVTVNEGEMVSTELRVLK